MLNYAIQSATVLTLLYWVFFALLSRESLHRMNRIILLGILLISAVLPLIPHSVDFSFLEFLEENEELVQEVNGQADELVLLQPVATLLPMPESNPWIWKEWLGVIYLFGICIYLIVLVFKFIQLARFLKKGLRHTDSKGNTVVLMNDDLSSFSVFHYIVMSIDDYELHKSVILLHEQEHIRLGHTWDLLGLSLVQGIQWFNPFVWLMGRDLKAVHEYEADKAVLALGTDPKSYQYLLVEKTVKQAAFVLVNGFNHSQLKNRIVMMNKRSHHLAWVRAMALLPVLLLSFVLTAQAAVSVEGKETFSGTVVSAESGKPMPGVSIVVLGTTNGTLSDADGHFTINTEKGKKLMFSFMGCKSTTVSLKNPEKPIVLKLQKETMLIDLKEVPAPTSFTFPEDNDGEEMVFVVVEEKAQFPGGVSELNKYIKENNKAGVKGKATVKFTVNADGTISNVHVSKSSNRNVAKAAGELVKSMPKWKPARQRGVAVSTDYLLPLTF